jgi:hypothetical protein
LAEGFRARLWCDSLSVDVSRADFWMVMFLAVALKLPLIGLFMAIWYAAKLGDEAQPSHAAPVARMALCGYCGTRITVGYDATAVHQRATQIASRTGQAAFDVGTRLVREELAQPDRHVVEPTRCPGCGEPAAWVTIEPLAPAAARAIDPVGPRG